jgi:hypothetical protein
MRRYIGIAAVLGVFALAAGALGQENKGKQPSKGAPPASKEAPKGDASKMSAQEKAAMDKMIEAGTPGEPHKKLDAVVGIFDAKVKMWMDPSKPAEDSSGTSESKWVLGNRYVETRYTGTFMGQPFSGIGYTGYDNVTKKYVGTWMDSASTGKMDTAGTADKSGKSMTLTGRVADPMTGKMCLIREKVTIADNDHHMMEMWGPDPSGKVYKMMEIHYTRKK